MNRRGGLMRAGLAMLMIVAASLVSAACHAEANVRVWIGSRGGEAFVDETLEFDGQEWRHSFEFEGETYIFVISARGTTWDMKLYRGSVDDANRIAWMIETDPTTTGSMGGCDRNTDYESTGGLWIEVGLRGSALSPEEACEQLRSQSPRP